MPYISGGNIKETATKQQAELIDSILLAIFQIESMEIGQAWVFFLYDMLKGVE